MEFEDYFEPIKGVEIVPDEASISEYVMRASATVGVCDDIRQWHNTQDLVSITCGGIMSGGIAVAECARLSRSYLVPKKAVREAVAEYSEKHFKGKVVGVHIRATEHFLSLCPVERFEQILDEISQNVLVYLATDSQPVAEQITKRYNKWHSRISHAFSPGAKILYRSKTLGSETTEGMMGAVVDLYLLNKCLRIYGTVTSSYNWMASIIENDVPLLKVGKT